MGRAPLPFSRCFTATWPDDAFRGPGCLRLLLLLLLLLPGHQRNHLCGSHPAWIRASELRAHWPLISGSQRNRVCRVREGLGSRVQSFGFWVLGLEASTLNLGWDV